MHRGRLGPGSTALTSAVTARRLSPVARLCVIGFSPLGLPGKLFLPRIPTSSPSKEK
jgi:hypothetical protein